MPAAGVAEDKPNPSPLWNAYPLDQNQPSPSSGASQNASTTTTPKPAAPAASANTKPVTVTEKAGDGPPWALMIVAAAGGALLVVALLALQGRRARRREEEPVGTADQWPWLGAGARNGAGEVRAQRLRPASKNGAARDFGVRPDRGAERAVEPAGNGTASEWVADRDRGVGAERDVGIAPAGGAAAERVAEPQPGAEREPVGEREPVAEAELETVAEAEPETVAEAETAFEAPANGAVTEHEAEQEPQTPFEAAASGALGEHEADVEPAAAADGVAAEHEAEEEADAEPEPVADAAGNATAAEHGVADGAAAEDEPDVEPGPVHAVPANGAVAERGPANGSAPEREFDVVEASAVPRQRFDREPATEKPAASRRGPICQVRWSAGAKCLFAVATDANGVEHKVAWSPPVGSWTQAGPPDEDSREARAALRVLAKDLRDKGWRPMRAKGDDFDETRWYARRFRFPVVEGDDDPAPWRHGPPQLAERNA